MSARLFFHSNRRLFASFFLNQFNKKVVAAVSTTSNRFSDVRQVQVPQRYNFVRDHLEVLAAEEKTGGKKVAYWWADVAGNELKLSFSDLVEKSKILANGLMQNYGLKPGDRVLLLLPRVPEWWFVVLACLRSGIVPIPAPIMLTEKDIAHRLVAGKPKLVFTIPEVAPKVDKAFADLTGVKCTRILCPQLTSKVTKLDNWKNFDTITSNVTSDNQCISNFTDDTMMIYFTSGTTGMPKMVNLTHGFALGHKFSTTPFLNAKPDKLVWTYADPGWVATLYGALFPPWYSKATVFAHYVPPSPPVWSMIFDVMKQYPVHTFITPPTVFRMMLHEKLPDPAELPHLKQCATGGEPLNPETFYAWKKHFGMEIRETFGQTESPAIIGNLPGAKVKPGSFGRSLGYDIRIIDDNLKELPTKEDGHIAIKCGQHRQFLFKEYIGNPKATAKSFQGDYYLTGDKGHRDEEGYLFFSSRADDVIISSGYRIGPFEIESALLEHPAVLESAAVSSPDHDRGEIVKSFVVLKENYRNHDKAQLTKEIQETAKRVTAPYKYPRKIEFIDELPKTISGKIKRAELRQLEWADHKN